MDRRLISCSRGATASCSSAPGAAIGARRYDANLQHLRFSIPNILQEPLGRDLPPLPLFHSLLVHPAADRGELQTLIADVAIEGHLIAAGPPLAFAGDEIRKVRLVATLAAIH